MIAKARAISHGGNLGRYSAKKWKAKLVKLNKIPKDLDPTTMWKLMEATQLKFRGKSKEEKLKIFEDVAFMKRWVRAVTTVLKYWDNLLKKMKQ